MNRIATLSLTFFTICLFFSNVELQIAQEYEDTERYLTTISEQPTRTNDDDLNVDDRWQEQNNEDENNNHQINNGIDEEEEMQADHAIPEFGESMEENNTEPQETTLAERTTVSIDESHSLVDVPKTTQQTEVVESSSIISTTETVSESYSVTETTSETTYLDSENTVEDNVFKGTTEPDQVSPTTQKPNAALTNENQTNTTISVNKMSDQIKLVLLKYRETGTVVVPDVKVPDPMHIPNMTRRMSMVNMVFENQTVYGLSNFTVQHINTDLDKMQVYVMLSMKRLVILGNYKMTSFFNRAAGPFNVTLLNVTTEGAAALKYNSEGKLEASETDMDMTFRDIKLDFKNLGYMGAFFQGVAGAVGSLIFEGIKAPILTEVNTKMKDDVNIKIRTMSKGLKTNSKMSPVDQAILEGRTYIKSQGYDPYTLKNQSLNVAGLLKINVTELILKGLSRFYRVGEVSLSMDNGTVEFSLHLAADNLTGSCEWSAGLGRTKLRDGLSSFTVDHIQGKAIIKQSLDLTKPPQLEDIDFLVGHIELRTKREDALEQVAELVVNKLPLLIRHLIVDGIEEPVKYQTQKLLNQVDVEKLLEDELPRIDQLGL